MRKAYIDGDWLAYTASTAVETRRIKARHFDGAHWETWANRTTLQDYLKTQPDMSYDDFQIQDEQIVEPLENALHLVNNLIKKVLVQGNCTNYHIILGGCDSWRVEHSTILRYKGNRLGGLLPIHLEDVRNFIINRHGATVTTDGMEADDLLVIETIGTENFIAGVDKDFYGCPVKFLNMNHTELGIQDGARFGYLDRFPNKSIYGSGRLFSYYQILDGDSSDNYCANCASDKRWGAQSAYKALKDCTTDKEAFQVLVDKYKMLYPAPKTITGWRGDDLKVDWLYVLQENTDMAMMLRTPDFKVNVKQTLDKLGVNY